MTEWFPSCGTSGAISSSLVRALGVTDDELIFANRRKPETVHRVYEHPLFLAQPLLLSKSTGTRVAETFDVARGRTQHLICSEIRRERWKGFTTGRLIIHSGLCYHPSEEVAEECRGWQSVAANLFTRFVRQACGLLGQLATRGAYSSIPVDCLPRCL